MRLKIFVRLKVGQDALAHLVSQSAAHCTATR
jgi:hypothetical protein